MGLKMAEQNINTQNMTGENLLVLSSQVLVVLKSELSSRGVKPTPANLRVVMEIIDKSLPSSLGDFFIQ